VDPERPAPVADLAKVAHLRRPVVRTWQSPGGGAHANVRTASSPLVELQGVRRRSREALLRVVAVAALVVVAFAAGMIVGHWL
jgi:hypothetical protein